MQLSWLACWVLAACVPTQIDSYTTLQGATMGTYYRVQAQCPVAPAAATIEAQLQAFNRVFSTYDPASELSRFNRAQVTQWVEVSPSLHEVLLAAVQLSADSAGAFDPTVGSLVELWGFGAAVRDTEQPSEQEIAQAMQNTGLGALELSDRTLQKHQARLQAVRRIDLSALAKGRGVDEVFEALVEAGCSNLLVDIGGEIRVRGHSPKQRPWRLAVEQPGQLASGNSPLPLLQLTQGAVATSGDYLNYREIDGVRYSHLIDPRDGYPITHGLASVTVWHPQAMWADGFATLISIVGPEEGRKIAEQAKLAVAMLIRGPTGFTTWQSGEFHRRFGGGVNSVAASESKANGSKANGSKANGSKANGSN